VRLALKSALVFASLGSGLLQESPIPDRPLAAKPKASMPTSVGAFFSLCDLDGNGWISLREARSVLGMEKTEFLQVDLDRDGRLDPAEFQKRAEGLLAKLGVLPGPLPPRSLPREGEVELAPEETPRPLFSPEAGPSNQQTLELYDGNASGGLDESEIERCLRHLELPLSADSLLQEQDLDRSEALELGEISPFARLLTKHLFARRHFGRTSERASLHPASRSAPLVFRRLDLDGDSFVGREDLVRLLPEVELPIRTGALLAALDRDGDGRLSSLEFTWALQSP